MGLRVEPPRHSAEGMAGEGASVLVSTPPDLVCQTGGRHGEHRLLEGGLTGIGKVLLDRGPAPAQWDRSRDRSRTREAVFGQMPLDPTDTLEEGRAPARLIGLDHTADAGREADAHDTAHHRPIEEALLDPSGEGAGAQALDGGDNRSNVLRSEHDTLNRRSRPGVDRTTNGVPEIGHSRKVRRSLTWVPITPISPGSRAMHAPTARRR